MGYDIHKISSDIKEAAEHVKPLSNTDDGGTCNFDSAFLRAPRMTDKEAGKITEFSGVNCFIMKSSLYGRILMIGIGDGQANRRTVMAEAARKFLETKGHNVGMYYQMD